MWEDVFPARDSPVSKGIKGTAPWMLPWAAYAPASSEPSWGKGFSPRTWVGLCQACLQPAPSEAHLTSGPICSTPTRWAEPSASQAGPRGESSLLPNCPPFPGAARGPEAEPGAQPPSPYTPGPGIWG